VDVDRRRSRTVHGGPLASTHRHDEPRQDARRAGVRQLPVLGDSWSFDLASTWSERKFDGADDTKETNAQNALRGFGGRECKPATGKAGVAPCYFFNRYGSACLSDPDSLGPNGLYHATALWEHMFDPILGRCWVFGADPHLRLDQRI
jgi:hypothetical protein